MLFDAPGLYQKSFSKLALGTGLACLRAVSRAFLAALCIRSGLASKPPKWVTVGSSLSALNSGLSVFSQGGRPAAFQRPAVLRAVWRGARAGLSDWRVAQGRRPRGGPFLNIGLGDSRIYGADAGH